MPELRVEYGIPEPGHGIPQFKEHGKGITTLSLSDFPDGLLPSGGLSGKVSASEMYMVRTCRPTTHTWKDQTGKVLSRVHDVTYSYIGRFPWEITMPGIYSCEIAYKGQYKGKVEFEVT